MKGERFEEMKQFLAFDPQDADNLRALETIVAKHGARITAEFYETLGANATTGAIIAGRVDTLKQTHARWMTAIVSQPIDGSWFEAQQRIGHVHVKRDIPPFFVELTFSLLRVKLLQAVGDEVSDATRACALSRSLVKALDMSLAIVNAAYAEERLDRLSTFTGFSRKLIENCINKGR